MPTLKETHVPFTLPSSTADTATEPCAIPQHRAETKCDAAHLETARQLPFFPLVGTWSGACRPEVEAGPTASSDRRPRRLTSRGRNMIRKLASGEYRLYSRKKDPK